MENFLEQINHKMAKYQIEKQDGLNNSGTMFDSVTQAMKIPILYDLQFIYM